MITCSASRRKKGGLVINNILHCCPSGNGGSTSTGCKVGLHQASTWGHVSRQEEELCILPGGCRIALHGHGPGGKQRRGERFVVAVALCKIDAGVALLLREVDASLLLCFYSGRRDMYVYPMSLLRSCFHALKIGRIPSINNIRSVSTMTTDCWQCRVFFLLERLIFFPGINSSIYKWFSRTSAVRSTNFRSILIFASCVVGTRNILYGWVFIGRCPIFCPPWL